MDGDVEGEGEGGGEEEEVEQAVEESPESDQELAFLSRHSPARLPVSGPGPPRPGVRSDSQRATARTWCTPGRLTMHTERGRDGIAQVVQQLCRNYQTAQIGHSTKERM